MGTGISYTGKGDDGKSRVGRKKYPKTGVEFAALGDVDELNSLLGVIKNRCKAGLENSKAQQEFFEKLGRGRGCRVCEAKGGKFFKKLLAERCASLFEQVQQDLFIIQAHIGAFWFEKEYKPPDFSRARVRALEVHIAQFEETLPPIKKFVVPGANELSAWFDYARAVSRRAERSVVAHHTKHPLRPAILSYCNRLSSLLFVLARVAVLQSDIPESNPHYNKRR